MYDVDEKPRATIKAALLEAWSFGAPLHFQHSQVKLSQAALTIIPTTDRQDSVGLSRKSTILNCQVMILYIHY